MRKFFLSSRPLALDMGLFLLRAGTGAAMIFGHGWPKLERALDGKFKFGDPIGIGPELSLGLVIFAEVLCSALLILGVATRAALIPLIITMAVAAFIVQGAAPFVKQELSLVYFIAFVALYLTGPGRFSLDRRA